MDESRLQEYMNLIHALLDCSSGEEVQVLSANQEFVDAGLVQTMLRVANEQMALGKLDAANFLMNLAGQLIGAYSNTPSPTSPISTYSSVSKSESQYRFLLQVLQATGESRGNLQVVYPLLQRNLDLLDDNFAQVLKNSAIATFSKVEVDKACATAAAILSFGNLIGQFPLGEQAINLEIAIAGHEAITLFFTHDAFPFEWALTQMNLGNFYIGRIRGEKAENLELAIQTFQQALLVFTRQAFPTNWAETQTNLGIAYSIRVRGKKANNFERAIWCHQQALSVFTREAFPIGWARAQNNLGLAYRDRIREEKADNIERAIWCHQQALQIYTREAFPADWAGIQINLGSAYRDRIRGEKADNIERAIQAYQQSLLGRTREDFPSDWAGIHDNLVGTYSNRIRGEKAENIERAIKSCQQALSVFTREAFPSDWARTQNNLGGAYSNRIRGEKADNIERAIYSYQQALSVFTREAFPTNWAETQDNLGIVYLQRKRGERVDNIERAVQFCQQALSIFTREAFPTDWAMTKINLGTAYFQRIRGDKAENIEQAIQAYQQALSVFTQEGFPADWARTQNNLGLVCFYRIRGDKAENIEQAIQAYQQALSVRTQETFPQKNVQTLFNLGIAYQTSNQLQLAHNTFEKAIKTVELLREEIFSGDDIKQKLAEEWTGLYHRMVTICLKMGRETEAIEYVERSKNRNLIELILSRDLHNLFPQNIADRLQQIREKIAIGKDKIQNNKADNPTALAQYLMQLREQRNELQNHYLPIGASFRSNQFQKIIDETTAVIEWFVTDDTILAFIIKAHPSQGQEISILQSTAEELKAFENWNGAYLKDYYQSTNNWQNKLTLRLEDLAKILNMDELFKRLPKECQRLILIPHRGLHLFPLHALPLFHDGKKVNLLDLFPKGVSYAPSCQLLLQAQKKQRPNFTHLFAIQNPTSDLAYTDLEVRAISDYFNPINILKRETATLTAINDTNLNAIHCAHFSCHGYFNQRNARKSALILANAPLATTSAQSDTERYLNVREGETHDLNQCLTLDAIFGFNLEQCRLVTLSACETGLIDFRNISDEYIGLPSGFLVAGSSSVVSSLWRVDDLSTALLMIKFYQNLKSGVTVALALNTAQIWLRDATTDKLQVWTNNLNLNDDLTKQIQKKLRRRAPDERPFHYPYHWAAFCAIGK